MQVQCECGRNRYRVMDTPLCRFVCHCRVCQTYTGGAFSDVMVYLAHDVKADTIVSTRFRRWRKPPNIRRGSCRHCGSPVIEYGARDRLVFVPVANMPRPGNLPPIDLHLFYHRRCDDIHDATPKLSGYFRSHGRLMTLLVGRLAGRLSPGRAIHKT